MRWALLTVLLALATPAAASPPKASRPNALGATVGLRLTTVSTSEIVGRVALGASRRWDDRWHTGVRFALDGGSNARIYQPAGELGIWLHASRSLDVLLGWRVSYARFEFSTAGVNAIGFEPVAEISYLLSERVEIRIAPFTAAMYFSGLWQVTFGPEVGATWRL